MRTEGDLSFRGSTAGGTGRGIRAARRARPTCIDGTALPSPQLLNLRYCVVHPRRPRGAPAWEPDQGVGPLR